MYPAGVITTLIVAFCAATLQTSPTDEPLLRAWEPPSLLQVMAKWSPYEAAEAQVSSICQASGSGSRRDVEPCEYAD